MKGGENMNAQMVFKEINIQTQPVTSKKTAFSVVESKKRDSSFEDLLKRATNNKSTVTDSNEKKTYAQVVNRSKAVAIKAKKGVNDTTKVVDVGLSKNEDENVTNASNSVIDGIAVLLGIDTESLKQLMANLNIKQEDLLDSNKVNEIVQQMSLKLGLTTEQEHVLFASVQQFLNLAKETVTNSSDPKDNWVVVEGIAIDVTKKDNKLSQNSISHLDEDIRQLAKSIKKENTSLFDNVPEKFTSLLEQFGLTTEVKKTDGIKEVSVNKTDKKDVKNESEPKVTEVTAKKEPSQNTESDLLNAGDTTEDNVLISQSKDNINQAVIKDDFIAKLQNVSTQHRVVKNELMKQVVEQAKVFVDENRSEMVMQLRPESLGKLTLKIVTENGIVAAKFVAESQQVKQILESNMQTLKDSLEKQGMSIQNVSVSVGQEGSQNSSQREAFERRSKGTKIKDEDLVYVSGIDADTLKKINPYEVSDNSIDVIA